MKLLAALGAGFVACGCAATPGPGVGSAREGDPCGAAARGAVAEARSCRAGLACVPKPVPPKPGGGPADPMEVDVGGACGGVAGYHCRPDLVCDGPADGPADGMGTCAAESICAVGPATGSVATRPGPGGDSGVGWKELTIESSTGPCPADGRSCFRKRHVFPSGEVVEEALANPTPEERAAHPGAPKFTETRRTLPPGDLRALDAILRSREFRRDVRGHFACARTSFDANIGLTISFVDGTASQDVTTCIIDRSPEPNLPKTIVELVAPR